MHDGGPRASILLMGFFFKKIKIKKSFYTIYRLGTALSQEAKLYYTLSHRESITLMRSPEQ